MIPKKNTKNKKTPQAATTKIDKLDFIQNEKLVCIKGQY